MSNESADSDSAGDWIFVTTEEKPQEVSPSTAALNFDNLVHKDGESGDLSESQMESQNLEDDTLADSNMSICTPVIEEHFINRDKTKDDDSSVASKDSSSSEIDILDDDDDGNIASLESSLSSHLSSFSMVNPSPVVALDSETSASRGVEVIHEDLSENSVTLHNDELPSDMELQAGVRHYVHVPNTRLNVTLNFVLALAVAAVIGLGIGNFLGRPGYETVKQLTYSEVLKLKELQDELLYCLGDQQYIDSTGAVSKFCTGNSDYWKEKFHNLFEENASLQEFMHVVQADMLSKNTELNKPEESVRFCTSEVKDEFHKLRLDLIVKQMEHLQLLKSFEEVKHQEVQSQERLKQLEKENLKLKTKLNEEEEEEDLILELEEKVKFLDLENKELKQKLDDEYEEDEIIRILEKRVQRLNVENTELREALDKHKLHFQILNGDILQHYSLKDASSINGDIDTKEKSEVSFDIKLNAVRQKINLLVAENEELKAVVARLRYSEPVQQKQKEDPFNKEMDHKVKSDNLQLNHENIKDESLVTKTAKSFILDDPVLISLKEQLENLRDSLSLEVNETKKWKQLFENIVTQFNNSHSFENRDQWWSKKLKHSFDSLQEAFFDVKQNLTEKWNDFQNFTRSNGFQKYFSQSKKTVKKVTEMFQNMIKKTHKVGEKMFKKHISSEIIFDKVKEKMWNIAVELEKKWSVIKTKWFNEMNDKLDKDHEYTKSNVHSQNVINKKSDESDNLNRKSTWHYTDKDHLAQEHKIKLHQGDWVFRRAQEREKHHKMLAEETSDEWYMRSAKGRSLKRKSKGVNRS